MLEFKRTIMHTPHLLRLLMNTLLRIASTNSSHHFFSRAGHSSSRSGQSNCALLFCLLFAVLLLSSTKSAGQIATTNPISFLVQGTWPAAPFGYAKRVTVSENRAFVTSHDGRLAAFDVTDPTKPKLVTQYSNVVCVAAARVRGNLAYLATVPGSKSLT